MAVGGQENTYDVGDKAVLTAQFTVGGVGTDPTTPVVKVKKPDGTIVSDTPDSEGDGAYSYELSIDQAGRWIYQFEGDDPAQALEPKSFQAVAKAID